MTIGEHRERVSHACHYLLRCYNIVLFYNMEWYTNFRNLVFPPPLAGLVVHVELVIVHIALAIAPNVVDVVVPNAAPI